MSIDSHSVQVPVDRHPAESRPGSRPRSEQPISMATDQTPLIDIHESAEGLILEADLPGVSDQTITVQLEENVLSLHAHVPAPAPEGSRPLHEEYHVGDFYRSFILSDEVERDQITAELKNGVLRLVLPKAERARTRRIEIKS